MSTKEVSAYEHKCERCQSIWRSNLAAPKACCKCKSPYWNMEKAARKFEAIYSLNPGESVEIPWLEPRGQIHPAGRIVRLLNKNLRLKNQPNEYLVSYSTTGAIVSRMKNPII